MKLHAAILAVLLTAAITVPSAAQSAPPVDDASARVSLNESSRHGEYVDIAVPGRTTPLRAFVVYPEIATKAPVVIVMHETYGLTDWVRGVTDQLAADGFIAIAPDLLTGKAPNGGDTTKFASRDAAVKASATLTGGEIGAALAAIRAYGTKLPAATGQTVTLTFPETPPFDSGPVAGPVAGIVRQPTGQAAANQPAALQGWPATVSSLRQQVK